MAATWLMFACAYHRIIRMGAFPPAPKLTLWLVMI